MVKALKAQGLRVKSLDDIWGQMLGVQAEIALDKDNGSRATAAAKLIAQALGTLQAEEAPAVDEDEVILGRELAQQVLDLIEAPQIKSSASL